MRIGLDLSLAVGPTAGVGRYSMELAQALAQIDDRNEYTLFPLFLHIRHPEYYLFRGPAAPNFKVWGEGVSAAEAMQIWSSSSRAAEVLSGFDLVHSTTFCAPPPFPQGGPRPSWVATIHDLSFLTHPECHLEANRIHCLRGTTDCILEEASLIAVSESTRQDLEHYFNVPTGRITVIPEAAHQRFFQTHSPSDCRRVLEKYGVVPPFVLTVGSLEPRKNTAGLVRAWNGLPAELRAGNQLVIGGGKGWLNSEIHRMVQELNLAESVRFIGYVDEADLPALYQSARVFAYPSLYEGFGLPVVEAMAGGTPVITSSISALAEIGQGAAYLVDPSSVEEIMKALICVLEMDPEEMSRWRAQSAARARQYDWAETAARTLQLYLKVRS